MDRDKVNRHPNLELCLNQLKGERETYQTVACDFHLNEAVLRGLPCLFSFAVQHTDFPQRYHRSMKSFVYTLTANATCGLQQVAL